MEMYLWAYFSGGAQKGALFTKRTAHVTYLSDTTVGYITATSFHSYRHHIVADFDLQSEKCVDAWQIKSNVADTIQIFGFTADASNSDRVSDWLS